VIGDDEIVAIIRHHHERLDGGGYPDGLAGDDIPLGSRIIAVADSFDAITSSRAYRTARKHRDAIEILKQEAGTQLDGRAVDAFQSYYGGRKSVKVWGVLVTAPQRVVELFGVAAQSAGSASLAQGVAAVAATAVIGSSMAGHAAKPDRVRADGGGMAKAAAVGGSHSGAGSDAASTSREASTTGRSKHADRPDSKRSRDRNKSRKDPAPGAAGGDHGEGVAKEPKQPKAEKAPPEHPSGGGKESAPAEAKKPEPALKAPSAPAPERSAPTPPSAPKKSEPPTAPAPAPPGGGGKQKGAGAPE
jgi:HD domain